MEDMDLVTVDSVLDMEVFITLILGTEISIIHSTVLVTDFTILTMGLDLDLDSEIMASEDSGMDMEVITMIMHMEVEVDIEEELMHIIMEEEQQDLQ